MPAAADEQLALKEVCAQVEQLQEDNAALRRTLGEVLQALQGKADSAIVDARITDIKTTMELSMQANQDMEREQGMSLAVTYLGLNQAAYAITILPVSTVLCMAPLYLRTELQVPIATIGYCMMAGELLGVVASKYAEFASDGVIFRRPNDIHASLLLVGVCLLAIPLWPKELWFGAAGAMILVMTCDAVIRPIVGEAIYRLSVVTKNQPSIKFAVASKWRRALGAIVSGLAPFAYMAHTSACFFGSAPILALLTFIMVRCARRIDMAGELSERFGRIMRASYRMSPKKFRLFAGVPGFGSKSEESKVSAIGMIENMTKDTAVTPTKTFSQSVRRFVHSMSGGHIPKKDLATQGSNLRFRLLVFAVVHLFPFMDAFISRLPFSFLTIAIKEQSGSLVLACMLLFVFQISRAVGNAVQSFGTNSAVDFWLTAVSVAAYSVLLASVLVDSDNVWWFYPVICTGLSETLPVQQFYLIQLFSSESGSEEGKQRIRDLVKVSHTLTGVGSAAAFFASSAVYAAFRQHGIGVLGVGAAGAKLALVVAIGGSLRRAPGRPESNGDGTPFGRVDSKGSGRVDSKGSAAASLFSVMSPASATSPASGRSPAPSEAGQKEDCASTASASPAGFLRAVEETLSASTEDVVISV